MPPTPIAARSPSRRSRGRSPPRPRGRSLPSALVVTSRRSSWPRSARPAAARRGADGARPTVTFYGRGYGHGVGMSQYGARGRALAGQPASDDPRPLLPGHDARGDGPPRRQSASWS